MNFEMHLRVYYEDTDAGGVVYHANYLKFFERARSEWLRSLGFSQTILREKEQNIFAVKKLSIRYYKPAVLDDLLSVNCRLIKTKKCSLFFSQEIFRFPKLPLKTKPRQPALQQLCLPASELAEELLVSADILIACIHSKTFKPTIISPALTKCLF